MKDRYVRSFFTNERQKLVSYVRSLLQGAAQMDAEDIVHDVLIKILDLSDLPTPDYLAAYTYRSLKNRVIDSIRTRKSTLSLDAETPNSGLRLIDLLWEMEGYDMEPNALTVLQNEERREALFAAMEKLAEIERQVLIAHEFEGLSFKDMSLQWGMPQNTLLSHKSRAMKKLKKLFLELGPFESEIPN